MPRILFGTLLFLILTPASAYAYIDPGTGSMILQLLLAGIAGIGLFLKLFWKRLTSLFSNTFGKTSGS